MGFSAGLNLAGFVLGLIVGSFLNAVIHRLHTGDSILEKHSRCPHCQHALAWRDLVPLASFIVLAGRCRYCQRKISLQYPLVELCTGFVFVLIAQNFQFSITNFQSIFNFQFLFQLVFTCFLIIIFVYDLKHYLILDKVLWPAVILAAGYELWQGNFWSAAVGALVLAWFFGLLFAVSRGRWIGFGDVKLGIFLGLLTGWPEVLVLFFLAYLSGAAVGVGLMAAGTRGLADRVPFGTFLTASAFVVMLWGEGMITWYFQLIGIR